MKKGSFQAMSSVWTMAERSTCRANRSARVVFPDAPRPSTATIKGLRGETLPALNESPAKGRQPARRAARSSEQRGRAFRDRTLSGSPPFRCPSKTAASKLTGALTHDRGCFD